MVYTIDICWSYDSPTARNPFPPNWCFTSQWTKSLFLKLVSSHSPAVGKSLAIPFIDFMTRRCSWNHRLLGRFQWTYLYIYCHWGDSVRTPLPRLIRTNLSAAGQRYNHINAYTHRIHVWYSIFTCSWLKSTVNEGNYAIHGSNGTVIVLQQKGVLPDCKMKVFQWRTGPFSERNINIYHLGGTYLVSAFRHRKLSAYRSPNIIKYLCKLHCLRLHFGVIKTSTSYRKNPVPVGIDHLRLVSPEDKVHIQAIATRNQPFWPFG